MRNSVILLIGVLCAFSFGSAQDPRCTEGEKALAEADALVSKEDSASVERSIAQYEKSLLVWIEIGDRRMQARTLTGMASAYLALNQADHVRELAGQAADLYHALDDQAGEATALRAVGKSFFRFDEPRKALEWFERALSLSRSAADRRQEAASLADLGNARVRLTDPQGALSAYLEAARIQTEVGDGKGHAETLASLGSLYSTLFNEQDKAMTYLERSLELSRIEKTRALEAAVLHNIGFVYYSRGQWDKAFDYTNRAVRLREALGDSLGAANSLNNSCGIEAKRESYAQAASCFEKLAGLRRSLEDRQGEALALSNLASAYIGLNRHAEAIRSLTEALGPMRESGDLARQGRALYLMAKAHLACSQLDEARASLDEALALTDPVRQTLGAETLRASYQTRSRLPHELRVDLLMRFDEREPGRGYGEEAFYAAERIRARSLLDMLAEARPAANAVPIELVHQRNNVESSLTSAAEHRLRLMARPHTKTEVANADQKIRELASQFEEADAQLKARSPHFHSIIEPRLLTAAEIRRDLLDADTILLEYMLGAEKSYLWALTRDSFSSHVLPKRAVIEATARRAWEHLSAMPGASEKGAEIQALSRMLLGPVEARLGRKRLAIVAEGAVLYIPFQALPLPSRPDVRLVAEHETVVLVSPSTLALIRHETANRTRPSRDVAVLADPVFDSADLRLTARHDPSAALPERAELRRSAEESGLLHLERLRATRREAEAISAVTPRGRTLMALDFHANRKTAESPALADYRVLHFATHGLLNNVHPELSGIVLSLVDQNGQPRPGFLQVHEIYNLKLNADLVVLSACQTALGKEVRGEGLMGLSRAFMYAGAARVLATLWQVPDLATAELMKRFYSGMFRDGLAPAAALRSAQASLAREPRWGAPYYWAGFVLQGDWR